MSSTDPGSDPGVEPDALPAERDGAIDADRDLAPDDSLLQLPLRQVLQVRALRGLVLLAISAAILLWPGRTGRALGLLVGLAVAAYTLTTLVDLVRNRHRRRFGSIVSVAVGAGFAAALLTRPASSLLSVSQAAAAILIGLAALTIVRVLGGRQSASWGITKAAGLAIGGGLLLAFPTTLVAAATAIVAGGLAALGLIDVFTPTPEREQTDRGAMTEMVDSLTAWIRHRPDVAEDRGALMEKIYFEGPSSPVRFARYATLMVLASAIAALGVVSESTAVVIGAMLVAPLMTPLMGTAFAVTMGWLRRVRRSAGIALLGMGLAIGVGAVVGSVVPRAVDVTTNAQILARIAPTTVDLAIAVAAGAAGAFALTRRDVSDSLPGVAVAISLVPPLTVVGLCWQQGEWSAGNGALLLFLTNAVAILTVGGATFVVVGAAPLQRVSAGQERWATVIVATASLAGLVVLLLLLNAAGLANVEVARAQVDKAVTEWTAEHDEYRLVQTRTLADGSIVVDLAGPGTPPNLEALLDEVEPSLDEGTTFTVTWVQQDQVSITGG